MQISIKFKHLGSLFLLPLTQYLVVFESVSWIILSIPISHATISPWRVVLKKAAKIRIGRGEEDIVLWRGKWMSHRNLLQGLIHQRPNLSKHINWLEMGKIGTPPPFLQIACHGQLMTNQERSSPSASIVNG